MDKKSGSALDEMKTSVKIDLKSILFATKDGYLEKELIKQYQFLNGKQIPYAVLGFPSLFDFMNDKFMQDSVRIERRGPTLLYYGVHNEATKNLGSLVTHQKDSEKERRELFRKKESIKSMRSISYDGRINLKLDGETVENLKHVIEIYCKEPTCLSSILTLYKEHTKKSLDLTSLGYSDISKFIDDKLGKSVKFLIGDNECMVMSRNSNTKCLEKSSSDIESTEENVADNSENKLFKLRDNVSFALANHVNINVPLANFYKLFVNKFGYPFDTRDYGFKALDELLEYLKSTGHIVITLDSENQKLIKLLPETLRLKDSKIFFIESMDSDNCSQKVYKETYVKVKKDNGKMKKFILEYSELDAVKVKKQFLKNQKCSIIVSNIIDPCYFQIQLEENLSDLDSLMEKLEKIYCGFGASIYDMSEDDLKVDRLCAATFSKDQNWHRCKIVKYDEALKKVEVFYLDYGGYDFVELKNVKFLDKEFAKWPVQVLDAKCHNLKKPSHIVWNVNIIKYMLMKVQGVYLTVKIMGTLNEKNLELFSLEILHKTKHNKLSNQRVKNFTLNMQFVKDGFAEIYEEKSLNNFIDYETLCKNYFVTQENATCLSISNSENDITNNSFQSLSFSNASVDIKSSKQCRERVEMYLASLRLKNNHMIEIAEFHDGNLKVYLFKIEDNTYVDCSHAAAILKITQNKFFELFSCSNLKRSDYFKTFKNSDSDSSSVFELYYDLFKENPTTIELFVFDKIELLMNLECAKEKKNFNIRKPFQIEEHSTGQAKHFNDIELYNAEILNEMEKNYEIYLREFDKSKKPQLDPLKNDNFQNEYRSFMLDEVYLILGQIKALDERISCEFISLTNKRWLEIRRKLLGKKFDALNEFINKLK